MYSGIVNVYKEQGFTSHDVVAKLRGIYGQKKVGHTGTLDPMAEGVLIVVLGQATKLADLILTSRKQYIATMRLGISTETDDTTGENVVEASPEALADLFSDENALREKLTEVFGKFLGKTMQVPPMYSAIKINGRKLYEYAREGIEIHPDPRPIEVFSLELLDVDMEKHEVRFSVDCSKGTYIRGLIRDMGRELGVGAAMSALLREEINGIYSKDGFRIEDLQNMKNQGRLEETVLPIDKMLESIPAVRVRESGVKYLSNGNRLRKEDIELRSGDAEKSEIEKSEAEKSEAERSDAKRSEAEKSETDPEKELENAEFFRVYIGDELKALYTYDKKKRDYKVFKML